MPDLTPTGHEARPDLRDIVAAALVAALGPPLSKGADERIANRVLAALADPANREALVAWFVEVCELRREHVAVFTEDSWLVEHPLACRLSGRMATCRYHAAVAEIADEYDPEMLGRWVITDIDSEGLPSMQRDRGADIRAELEGSG